MTEQKQMNSENAPVFRLQKFYVKDLSFENPNAPEVFKVGQAKPKVDINLSLKNKKLDEDHHEVVLSINATIVNEDDGKTLFIVEIDHAGIFLLKNIPQEHLHMVLMVDCPALMFPFTRQILCQLTIDGGFTPFLMEPVNFLALYENAKKNKQDEGQKH